LWEIVPDLWLGFFVRVFNIDILCHGIATYDKISGENCRKLEKKGGNKMQRNLLIAESDEQVGVKLVNVLEREGGCSVIRVEDNSLIQQILYMVADPITRAGEVLAGFPGSMTTAGSTSEASPKKIDMRLSNILSIIGIAANIKGFGYIKESVKICIADQQIVGAITKSLYPAVAAKFNTSASKVERAIRHAIQVCWDRGRLEKLNEIFGIPVIEKNDKPTNGEFISYLAERLIIENAE